MGQSNVTSPLDAQQKNQQYNNYNYSRLINLNNNQINNNKKYRPSFSPSINNLQVNNQSYFKLNRFESLNGDDLLVRDRQNKLLSPGSSSLGTFKNTSNFKLIKQANSLLSRTKITSIANLQLPQQQTPIQSQSRTKVSHVKFASNQRIVCKNFIFSKAFDEQSKKYYNKIINYFVDQESMQNYVSNLVKLNQALQSFSFYDDFNIIQEEQLFIVERTYVQTIDLTRGKLTKTELKENVTKLLDYLHFLAKIYQKIDHIYIDPEDVYFNDEEFYLADFKYKDTTPFEMILATLQWIFKGNNDPNDIMEEKILQISTKNQRTLQECFYRRDQLENSSSFPFYVRQLWKNLVDHKIDRSQLLPYIERLKFKALSLSMNIDSFHACLNHKRTWSFHEEKHCWLIGKRVNQLYFYNMNDDHRCQVKVIRKKKKVDLSQIKIVFDPQQLQIKYVAENSKIIIHIAQFQLEKPSCKSDIEIKHRLPIKFKNPYLFYNSKKQQIFILQNSVYKYSIAENKLSQQTKKILEYIFLARSYDFQFMVIKMSIDIFRNGIRVFLNQNQVDLFFVGEQELLEEMLNVRVDIRSVQFCKEVYKGVYLMMASRNLWILDLNFNIFFSYATIQRVKSFYGFASVANSTTASKSRQYHRRNFSKMSESSSLVDYAFQIFNQPFKVEFLNHQDGLNVRIKDDQLHIIGHIEGNLYYLKYGFLPEAGSLRLLEYKPLVGVNSKKDQIEAESKGSIMSIQQKQEKIPKRVNIAEVTHIDYIDQSHIDENEKKSTLTPIAVNVPKQKIRRSKEIRKMQLDKGYQLAAPLLFDKQFYQIYYFNFHQENLLEYKTQCWLFFEEQYFVKVQDFYLKVNKTNYEIQLKIKKVTCSLKDLIEKMKKYNENKSAKQKKYFTRQQCLLYMIRCVDIYVCLIKNQLYHKNLSVANYYFMAQDNSLKLIGWSQPQRNWYVSDFKDLLLVFFNIITCNTLEKLNQKMLYKYKTQLLQFSLVYDKMLTAFKYMKVSQKKSQIAKQVKQIKDYLFNQLSNRFLLQIQNEQTDNNGGKVNVTLTEADLLNNKQNNQNKINDNGYLFNFQYNTPRFSMMCLLKRKLKKMRCLLDENSKEQFIFQSFDKYLWDGQKSKLYIFTSTYQFYELKINTSNFKQQQIVCQEYEYLPNNILDSTFILTPSHGIISVGGVFKAKDTELTFNKTVYKFNPQKLTWDPICEIPQPRINPYLALSSNGKQIYCFGGEVEHCSQSINVIKISFPNKLAPTVQLLKDSFKFNPFSQIGAGCVTKIYNLSNNNLLFLLFGISSDKYLLRIFSLNSFCVDHSLETKNYSDDNKSISQSVGITLNKDNIHVLRQYGKHAKISLNKLESLVITNQTIYPQREDKVQ